MLDGVFLKVTTEDDRVDLSEFVESLVYEESTEKENMATIILKEDNSLEMVDSEYLVPAKKLNIQFGFLGKLLSDAQSVIIGDIGVNYRTRIQATIMCYDAGLSMKKASSNKIWKAMKGSEIVEEIATRYGLETQIVDSTDVRESEPQGNRSDFEFLKYLAETETSEKPYTFYVTSKTLVYKPLDFSQESSITYKYGESDWVSFKPTWKELSSSPAINQSTTISVDVDSKEAVNEVLSRGDDEDTSLGEEIMVVYNAAGEFIREEGGGETGSTKTSGKLISSPAEDIAVTQNKIKNRRKKETLKILEGPLIVALNPKIRVGMIITLSGLAKRHTGNWYCKTVTHKVKTGLTELSLSKDGAKSVKGLNFAVESADVNNTQGDRQVDSKKQVEVVVFDAEGNELRTEAVDPTVFQPAK